MSIVKSASLKSLLAGNLGQTLRQYEKLTQTRGTIRQANAQLPRAREIYLRRTFAPNRN